MPIYNDNPLSPLMHKHSHGNFILKFKIDMPNKLSTEQKKKLTQILEEQWKQYYKFEY